MFDLFGKKNLGRWLVGDAVLFGNGIGNFVLATPLVQNLSSPTIFIPGSDGRREAIASISTWPVEAWNPGDGFAGHSRIFHLWACPIPAPPGATVQPRPQWRSGVHEADTYLALIPGARRFNPTVKREGPWTLRRGRNERLIALIDGGAESVAWSALKRWPADRWITLAKQLISDGNTQLVHLGDKREVDFGRELVKAVGYRCWPFAGELTLAQSANILAQCDMMICNDTGLMHIGAAVGVPMVVLWGMSLWSKNHPLSQAAVVKVEGNGCEHISTCFGTPTMRACKRAICMEAITVEMALAAAEELLDLPAARGSRP